MSSCRSISLDGEYSSISDATIFQFLQRLCEPFLSHLEGLNCRLNTVTSAKVQHLSVHRSRGYKAGVDVVAVHEEGKEWDFELLTKNTQGNDYSRPCDDFAVEKSSHVNTKAPLLIGFALTYSSQVPRAQ